jgi:hypothetical protein
VPPVDPPPVTVPTTPTVPSTPPAATVPQVVDPVTGLLVDAQRGLTCDDLPLTPIPVCPAGV